MACRLVLQLVSLSCGSVLCQERWLTCQMNCMCMIVTKY